MVDIFKVSNFNFILLVAEIIKKKLGRCNMILNSPGRKGITEISWRVASRLDQSETKRPQKVPALVIQSVLVRQSSK